MSADDALAGWLRLTLAPGIGGETQRRLLNAFGLPERIFSVGRTELRRLLGAPLADKLLDTDNGAAIEAACRWAEGEGQSIVTLADPEYPQALLEIADPPTVLYVRGRVELLNRPALAIVGSRVPTPQGARDAESFAAAFCEAGLAIGSGLALGIDAAAHRGALSVGGDTLAFVGTGIDRMYPARNMALATEIAQHGAIVSEFPLGTPALAANFPRRNRLISGCARGVLVVEAAAESGSLITARLAGEQGREVFAIPGSIHSPQSRGCHKLIRQGAKLVETANDVLEECCWRFPARPAAAQSSAPADAAAPTDEHAAVLAALGFAPSDVDDLGVRTGLPAERLAVLLLELELAGKIATLPGGRYQKLG